MFGLSNPPVGLSIVTAPLRDIIFPNRSAMPMFLRGMKFALTTSKETENASSTSVAFDGGSTRTRGIKASMATRPPNKVLAPSDTANNILCGLVFGSLGNCFCGVDRFAFFFAIACKPVGASMAFVLAHLGFRAVVTSFPVNQFSTIYAALSPRRSYASHSHHLGNLDFHRMHSYNIVAVSVVQESVKR